MRLKRFRAVLVISILSCFAGTVFIVSDAATAQPSGQYLPTDGWKPGDGGLLMGIWGPFHATVTPSGVCGSMGVHPGVVYLWPAGYRVRLHPTELVGPSGKVIAHQGQWVNAAGGSYPWLAALALHPPPVIPSYCGSPQDVILLESPVLLGKGLPKQ